MKPRWSDAPEWAKHLAMDEDGWWWWYEKEPNVGRGSWRYDGKCMAALAPTNNSWRDTLEPRPLDSSTPS